MPAKQRCFAAPKGARRPLGTLATDSLNPYPAGWSSLGILEGGALRAGLSREMYGLSVLQSSLILWLHKAPPIEEARDLTFLGPPTLQPLDSSSAYPVCDPAPKFAP